MAVILIIIVSLYLCVIPDLSILALTEYQICFNRSVPVLTDEQRLFMTLMHYYDNHTRPVFNASHAVDVYMGITLTQIFDVEEKNQVMTTNVWLDQEWWDEKLKWNPDDFNGLKMLRVPCHTIWKPDIILYNSAEDYTNGYMQALAMVSYKGKVFWPPIVKFRSTCHIDITYFPFDDQLCHMKFGSWAYDGFQVDVFNRSNPIDLSNFVSNGEWDLLSVKAERHVVKYPCCPEPFPDVTFSIHLRRRTLYYMYNVIVPCIMLSVLTLLVFWMSPDSGEKVTLGLTVLLAFSVFMLLIAENMPATSSFVPLIGIYLTTIMALTSMSVILAVVVSNISNSGHREKALPPFIRAVVILLSKVCCIKLRFVNRAVCDGQIIQCASKRNSQMFYKGNSNNISHDSGCGLIDFENGEPNNGRNLERANKRRDDRGENRELNELLCKVHEMMCRENDRDKNDYLCKQWQEVGIVVDRCMFWIFVLGTSMSTIYLLVIMPMTKPDKTS
ncbi:neuronal acetylcholine receptor subunit alpha-10 isoform X1 [Patella vulgata]|uniref:neuronal acetylcholine receptor subunit alpha-10 isoform X1 n=2 Tax=Patella vulgata TaxID=6465 RepID=UPI00218080A7|nr:neuronal acetylcholine receptor subunit alpha-10 isoform X1 [Patella vulgata]